VRAGGRTVSVRVRHPRLDADRRGIARAVRELEARRAELAAPGAPPPAPGELGIALLGDAELAGLHARFLGDPAPTDVITFEAQPSLGSAGEICVSVDAAVRQAGPRPAALSAELALYLVHGWLHLAGHDDLRPLPRRAMRRAEARALALLARKEALPRFSLRKKTRAIRTAAR
jgi:probable rRNA maturation factor